MPQHRTHFVNQRERCFIVCNCKYWKIKLVLFAERLMSTTNWNEQRTTEKNEIYTLASAVEVNDISHWSTAVKQWTTCLLRSMPRRRCEIQSSAQSCSKLHSDIWIFTDYTICKTIKTEPQTCPNVIIVVRSEMCRYLLDIHEQSFSHFQLSGHILYSNRLCSYTQKKTTNETSSFVFVTNGLLVGHVNIEMSSQNFYANNRVTGEL